MAVKPPFDPFTSKVNHVPDSRMSWIVMFASFGSLFIVAGYQRSFGLLFVAYNEKYGYSSGSLSVISAVQSFSASLCGMVVMNFILKKISIRMSCMIGATIQAIGTILGYWLKSIDALIVCHGFMFGLGHSMLYCPNILIVSQYFERHRSIAMAISQCGSSFGGIAFPYITRLLIDSFGLEGGLLILGAIIFNQLIFYAWFRPIIRLDIESKSTKKPGSKMSNLENGETQPMHDSSVVISNNQDVMINSEITDQDGISLSKSDLENTNVKSDKIVNYNNGSESIQNGVLSSSPKIYSIANSKQSSNPRLYSSNNSLTHRHPSNQNLSYKDPGIVSLLEESKLGLSSSIHDLMVLQRMEDHTNTEDEDDTIHKKYNGKTSEGATVANGEDPVDVALLKKDSSNDPDVLKGSCIPEILKMRTFWIIAVFAIGGVIPASCPALFIPPLAREKGLSNSDAAFFLMISAATDFVGRLLSGLILHFKLTDSMTLVMIPLGMTTLMFNLTPILNGFYPLMLLTLIYGLGSSMFWTLWNLVLIDVLGLANLGPALGFLFVIAGITTSASFPLAGLLHDITGTYSASFHYFGAASLMSMLALICLMIPKCKARCASRRSILHDNQQRQLE